MIVCYRLGRSYTPEPYEGAGMMLMTIESEREEQGAWSFDLLVEPPGGDASRHTLRLSWADYDHWCRGAARPAAVAHALAAFLLERLSPDQLEPQIDASTVRRRFPEVDREIRALIES